ncbi:MAG: hypothetical protein WCC10_05125 [Tumebacillaceae bacterium]
MKKWVISGIVTAFLVTLTGALVTGEKNAVILPKDPEAVIMNVDVTANL